MRHSFSSNVTRFTIGGRNLAEISNLSVTLAIAILLLQAHPARLFAQNDWSDSLQPVSQAPLTRTQLEQLVAPIALYPDPLVAQVLAASTYPEQVQDADRWREAQGYASPEQIADGADMQSWDPAVKALTALPRVLAQMDRNLEWTTDLGNAYYNQPQDVLEAVQVMRRRARAAGTLETTPQAVVDYDQGVIEIAPPTPQIVYVPTYNPWVVYGEPLQPYPGFSLLNAIGEFVTGAPLRYGVGIAMSAFTHTPWGWLAWGLNWLTQAILFNHDDYFTHSTTVADWGFPHRGFHAYAGRVGFNRFSAHSSGMRSGEGWSHFGHGEHGWNSLDRGRELRTENWGARSNSGFQNFPGSSFRENRNSWSPTRMQEARAVNRSESFPSQHENPTRSSHRAPASMVARSDLRGRSNGFSSRDFWRSSSKSSSRHLLGGARSRNALGNHRSTGFHFGGRGRAAKSFGGGKSFSKGHSHGGGGHSAGRGRQHH